MEWLKNLSNAIEYIEENLAGEISYEEAAKIACCSTYYFQRMFSYVAGIPLSEYIRHRRMTQAAFELQTTDSKVLDVALKYGYASPTSFNRAFQSVHGISPISAKAQGSVLNAYPPIRFSVKITGGNVMPYRVEEKEAMRISNQSPKGVLGITACQSPDKIYYYIAAATDKPVPKDMFEYEIPSATWVIFESNGYFKESVQSIFRRFLTEWLPFSGYASAPSRRMEKALRTTAAAYSPMISLCLSSSLLR